MRTVTGDAAPRTHDRRGADPTLTEGPSGPVPRPPWWVLGVAMLAMGVLVGLTLFSQLEASAALRTVDFLCAGASLTLLPWLLRRPDVPAVLLVLLAGLSPAVTPPATMGVLVVAQRRPLRTALCVGALGVAAHAFRGWWRPVEGLSFGWWLVLDVVAHAALVGIGALLRAQARLVRSLRERASIAEAEQGRKVAEARAAERTRIAREMHDVLAHRLSLLATSAGALEYRPDAPPERIAAAAGVVRAGVHEALRDLREVIGLLRDDDDAAGGDGVPSGGPTSDGSGDARRPQPVLDDIPALVEESRAAGTTVRLIDDVDAGQRPAAGAGRSAYRIIQEALTNARKHAPGSPVTVRLAGAPGSGLTITVGNPIRPAAGGPSPLPVAIPGSGTGLIGLAERARLAGGHLEHGATAGGEFRVSAWLPWPE